MKKGLFALFFLSVLLFSLPTVIAGEADKWKSCCSSGCDYSPSPDPRVFPFGTYYCCGPTTEGYIQYCNKAGSTLIRDKITDSLGWKTSACSYADDDSYCGDPNWPGGDCTGNSACAGKVAGGSGSCCDSNCQPIPNCCSGSLSLSISGTWTCTVSAVVSVANCPSNYGWQVKDDGVVKCSGTGNVQKYNCPSWTVTSGSSGTAYTYNLYINNVKNDTGEKTCRPTTTTTTTTTTPTTTTTTIPSRCPNTICEYNYNGYSENQINCPQDCKTTLELYADGQWIYPTTYLRPSQSVTVIVTFNDSRYNSTQGFNLELNATINDQTLNQIIWNKNTGCKVCGETLKNMECTNCGNMGYMGGDWSRHDSWYEIKAHMENGYGRIEFNATLPQTMLFGMHTLKVTPVLRSLPITLSAAETVINISDGLYSFVITVRNVFNRIAILFIRPLA